MLAIASGLGAFLKRMIKKRGTASYRPRRISPAPLGPILWSPGKMSRRLISVRILDVHCDRLQGLTADSGGIQREPTSAECRAASVATVPPAPAGIVPEKVATGILGSAV